MFSTSLCLPPWGDEHNRADDWGDFAYVLVSDAPEVVILLSPPPNLGDALLPSKDFSLKVAQSASNCTLNPQLDVSSCFLPVKSDAASFSPP